MTFPEKQFILVMMSNHSTNYTIHAEIDINASISQVWNNFIEFKAYPEWNPFMTKIEGIPKRFERLRVELRCPGAMNFTFYPKVMKVVPSMELEWHGTVVSKFLGSGTHCFRVEKVDSRFTRFIQFSTIRGLWVPGMKLYFGRKFRDGFELMNQALKRRAELRASG